MDDGSTSAIFWKQEAPVAAAEGNFDFQEIASFLPVSLFFFSANRQKENLSKRKKKEKKRIFLSHHAITADSASTARRKVHFAARQCLTHEFLHESPILFLYTVQSSSPDARPPYIYIYQNCPCISAGKIDLEHFVLSGLDSSRTVVQQNFLEISKFSTGNQVIDRLRLHITIHQYFSPTKFSSSRYFDF